MKSFNLGVAKRLTISLVALAALGGCAIVPYNAGYYDQPAYVGGPVYAAPAPVYVGPPVSIGLGFGYYRGGGRGYYGHGHRGWR
ncbi:MAG: hypothetical protein V4448_13595 [Pseudomonadota bacterium]|jgi:hypothetical protein